MRGSTKNLEYRSNDNVSSFPRTRESRFVSATISLDTRLRGYDQSSGENVPATAPPFSFVVRELKFMTHFVVSYLTTTDWDTLLKSSASFTLQLE